MARSTRGEKFRRIALYLPPSAAHRLDLEALARSDAAGVGLSSESTARALVYAGLGLSADGLRAVGAPAGGESDWLTALRGFARCMGARVEVEGEKVLLVLKEGTAEGERGWTAKRIEDRCPPPAGVVFVVQVEGAPRV